MHWGTGFWFAAKSLQCWSKIHFSGAKIGSCAKISVLVARILKFFVGGAKSFRLFKDQVPFDCPVDHVWKGFGPPTKFRFLILEGLWVSAAGTTSAKRWLLVRRSRPLGSGGTCNPWHLGWKDGCCLKKIRLGLLTTYCNCKSKIYE